MSLASISEIEEDDDKIANEFDEDSEDFPASEQEQMFGSSSAIPTLSSYATTPDIVCSDEDTPSIPRDSFSRMLYAKLQHVLSIRSSSLSTVASITHFSPGISYTSTPPNASKKRSASSSLESTSGLPQRKKPRIASPPQTKSRIYAPKSKRALTLTDDERETKRPRRFGSSRPASLRRADSLKVTTDDWIPTAPSTPPPEAPPGVPVIAPPADFVPLPAPTARTRLQAYKRREQVWRANLYLGRLHGNVQAWESHLGLGARKRRQVVNWIVGVQPGMFAYDRADSDDEDMDVELEDEYADGLADQLAIPETRFHAAYLFLLFAFKKGFASYNVWDLATACVAVSAKVRSCFFIVSTATYSVNSSNMISFRRFCPYMRRISFVFLLTACTSATWRMHSSCF